MPREAEIILGQKSVTGNLESAFSDEVAGLAARLGVDEGGVKFNGNFATVIVRDHVLTIYQKPRERGITVFGAREAAHTLYPTREDPLLQRSLLKVLENAGYRVPLL